jgi:hypothetical protein
LLVEPIQLLRWLAVLARPELDEAEDLLGLFALADVGVRVVKDLAVGVLSQEGKDTRLPTASLR